MLVSLREMERNMISIKSTLTEDTTVWRLREDSVPTSPTMSPHGYFACESKKRKRTLRRNVLFKE